MLLLENERNEWELPGGKLELGEDPPDCVVREISEETGWQVTAGPLLDCWQYHIREGSDVVIVTYGCHVLSSDPPVVSNEHKQAGLFTPGQVPELVMPDGYKRPVAAWGRPPERAARSLTEPRMGGRCQRCGSPGSPSGIPPSCAACQGPARLPGPGALVAAASWLAAGRSQPGGDPGAILRGYRHAQFLRMAVTPAS